MSEPLKQLVDTFNALSPLGLAGLLAFIIYKLIEGNKRLKTVQTNHLHELPEMAETLRRIELNQAKSFTEIVTLLKSRQG
jgi:hypothetical protein